MRKETVVQVRSEIEKVDSEISKLEYHLVGVKSEKKKTEKRLSELRGRAKTLKSYL
ncbi:hypothetical protein [Bacillus pseudomycoides]|uniref:hypothetical protein n=1 Tax=Bacillus pseudomycoides TaxID=64104 RepID=UPI002FFF4E0B